MEPYELEYVESALAELRKMAKTPGCASGPARDALRRIGTLEQAYRRWRDAVNGEGRQHG